MRTTTHHISTALTDLCPSTPTCHRAVSILYNPDSKRTTNKQDSQNPHESVSEDLNKRTQIYAHNACFKSLHNKELREPESHLPPGKQTRPPALATRSISPLEWAMMMDMGCDITENAVPEPANTAILIIGTGYLVLHPTKPGTEPENPRTWEVSAQLVAYLLPPPPYRPFPT